jgi:hypothetical protein
VTAVADYDHYTRSFYGAQRFDKLLVGKGDIDAYIQHARACSPIVVDLECGVGTWLRVALDLGAIRVQAMMVLGFRKPSSKSLRTASNLATLQPWFQAPKGCSERYGLVPLARGS